MNRRECHTYIPLMWLAWHCIQEKGDFGGQGRKRVYKVFYLLFNDQQMALMQDLMSSAGILKCAL